MRCGEWTETRTIRLRPDREGRAITRLQPGSQGKAARCQQAALSARASVSRSGCSCGANTRGEEPRRHANLHAGRVCQMVREAGRTR